MTTMKKQLLAAAMLIMALGSEAENLKVANVVLPQNGTVAIEIELENPNTVYDSFSFQLELPEGVVPVMAANGYPDFKTGGRFTGAANSGYIEGNIATFSRLTDGNTITGTSGMLIAPIVKVNGELPVGTVLTATVSDVLFTTTNLTKERLEPVTFTITIDEPTDTRTVLDELSTEAPEAATGVDVRVKRTLAAGVWNTICLPFAMSAEQVTAAFGSEVQLGDFNGIESTYDEAEENIIGILVNFNDATAIEANHPYIIKVKDAISEFTVDGVDITPTEELSVDKDEYSYTVKGKTYYMYNSFVGTFVANTEVPENCLFLNSNMFYYSTGATTMKAFRAYFDFYDILSEVENAEARISFAIAEDQATGISNVKREAEGDDKYYNLKGQRVEKPGKGIYIFKGKKVKK